ncbi:hypothetical protein [uncultured Aquimarina sp.]|uniref:hypothetical protein n=1 Tax=uncultured Aquimarina sp. TaxID=575652 RepID=UPI0026329E34|nr:hypothetical protein [uncultured Aquimarina sp.]
MKENSALSKEARGENMINFDRTIISNKSLNNYENKKSLSFFFIALCVLTIVGSLFVIIRGFWYQLFSDIWYDQNTILYKEYYRGWLYVISGIGTLIGAIIMVGKRKRIGLYVYTVSQVMYIITIAIAAFSYTDIKYLGDVSELAFAISILFLVPAILFLVFYWLNATRKYLH